MRLTRRGRVVGAGVAGIFLWATFFGLQTLNALVLPGVIALVGSWVIVKRADEPDVRRKSIQPDSAGEVFTVGLEVSVPSSLTASVIDSHPPEIRIVGNESEPVRGKSARYTAIAERRGVYTIGPATVEVTDPLGLVADRTETEGTATLVAYPPIHPLSGIDRGADALLDGAPTPDRHEFDQLREYQRGDAVRDIDWKSSAKRAAEPLVVKEFVSETAAGDAVIVASSKAGGADAMASATASLACHLLDRGVSVGIRTADERIDPAVGDSHRRILLTALARTRGGPVESEHREGASILVEAAGGDDVLVTLGSGRREFNRMTGTAIHTAASDGGWDQ